MHNLETQKGIHCFCEGPRQHVYIEVTVRLQELGLKEGRKSNVIPGLKGPNASEVNLGGSCSCSSTSQ